MEHNEKNRKNLIRLVGSALTLAVALVALVMATLASLPQTLAWFMGGGAMNVTGMEVRTGAELFELAVHDDTSAGEPLHVQVPTFDESDPTDPDQKLALYLMQPENGGYAKISQTNAAQSSLFFEMHTLHDPGAVDEGSMAPGSFGTVSFDIVPKIDTSVQPLVLDIRFNYLGLGSESDGTPVAITNEHGEYDVIHDLLCGHVLLYRNATPVAGSASGSVTYYYYSDCLNISRTSDASAGVYRFDSSDSTTYDVMETIDGESHYIITLYWIWPTTFSQLTSTRGESTHIHTIYDSTDFDSETERQAMLTFIQENPELFFTGVDLTSTSPYYSHFMASGFESTLYTQLTAGYNDGDQELGDNVTYFVIRADAYYVPDPSAP